MGTRRLIENPRPGSLVPNEVDTVVRDFHRHLPGYWPTPLRESPNVAEALGVGTVFVKDESNRLGMPSFKILGASWATYRLLCQTVGTSLEPILKLSELREMLSSHLPLELVAATDGNHGRAVARMARELGLTAHIFVPEDMVPARVAALKEEGARVTIVAGGYDDAIRASAEVSDANHLVVSDTSWPGYSEVPGWVIDGYSTIGLEIDEQLALAGNAHPTVVALQVGVGAFAASMVSHFYGRARLLSVEPTSADCVIASVEVGEPITIPGPQDSIMAGLNCGAPSLVAWPRVSGGIDWFAAVDDEDARAAMRLLASDGIVSGESGAAGLAGLLSFRDELGLKGTDSVLLISTEGATDPTAYERIVSQSSPLFGDVLSFTRQDEENLRQ